MATRHQQISEGQAFVEPRNVDTVRGLLAAAEELGHEASVVRTQQGGYLAPSDVVAKWQEGETGDAVVTSPDTPSGESPDVADDSTPAKNAPKGDWVAFAVMESERREETPRITDDEAKELTKDQLIERYGATE